MAVWTRPLAELTARLAAGQGGVAHWAGLPQDQVKAVQTALAADRRLVSREADAAQLGSQPWAPFASLALAEPALGQRLYFRHRHLWKGPQAVEPEPLIDEEFPYERARLADALLDTLAAEPGPCALVVVRHAERLSREAFFLTERLRAQPSRALGVLLLYEGSPAEPDLFESLDVQGLVTWLGPVPGGAAAEGTALTEAQEHELERWLCFETLVARARGPRRLEALAALGRLEEGIELGESLVREHRAGVQAPVRRALGRLYRQAGDPAQAARNFTLAWKEARDLGDAQGQVQAEFHLFETSYRAVVTEDVSLGLEERMVASLRRLGWANHLAYVFTKNTWVQTIGRVEGWPVAVAVWTEGDALARRLGNLRRRAVSLQTRGSLLLVEGHLTEALRVTRIALGLAKRSSTGEHAVRVHNGLGFLYLATGNYRKAYEHHLHAVDRLAETSDPLETIGTLVNFGRLYLINGEPLKAIGPLAAALRTMDALGLEELPFHPRSNLLALLGCAYVQTGQPERAREYLRKVAEAERRGGRPLEHRACLEALLAVDGAGAGIPAALEAAAALMEPRLADLRHLLLWLFVAAARTRSVQGRPDDAARLVARARGWLAPLPLGRDERLLLEAAVSGRTGTAPLPVPRWDNGFLLRFARQEASLRSLRRSVRDFGFLQLWHSELTPDVPEAEVLARAVSLVRRHFPVEGAAVVDGLGGRPLAVSEGWKRRTLSPVTASFALTHDGLLQGRLLCLDTSSEPLFSAEDGRVLQLAAAHLSLLLSSGRKTRDLEERQHNLRVALDTLREAQDKLVRSENLAVLGSLAAGLAHELNTPLAAILSSARSLSGLLDRGTTHGSDLEAQLLRRQAEVNQATQPQDRAFRRDLAARLKDWGAPDPETQAELWIDAGLGREAELQRELAARPDLPEVLVRLHDPALGRRLLWMIGESAARAEAVVASLRTYLSGALTEASSRFDLRAEVAATLQLLGLHARPRVKVVWAGPETVAVTGRRWALSQVWTNLIQNAVQAMAGHGTLTLTLRADPDWAELDVADSGPGVPAELQERIFEPFFSTKRSGGGMGLGLDICRRIVEAHSGTLSLASEPGRTVFTVRLPRS